MVTHAHDCKIHNGNRFLKKIKNRFVFRILGWTLESFLILRKTLGQLKKSSEDFGNLLPFFPAIRLRWTLEALNWFGGMEVDLMEERGDCFFLGELGLVRCQGVIKEKSPHLRSPAGGWRLWLCCTLCKFFFVIVVDFTTVLYAASCLVVYQFTSSLGGFRVYWSKFSGQ